VADILRFWFKSYGEEFRCILNLFPFRFLCHVPYCHGLNGKYL